MEDIKILENSECEPEENKSSKELFNFAFCGTKGVFNSKLDYLAELAEKENWSVKGNTDPEDTNHILRFYIMDTFDRCKKENKIIYTSDGLYCAFNTGLLTKNSQDILCVFVKNDKQGQPWKLYRFLPCDSIDYMTKFDKIAELAKYWSKYEELYYDPSLDLQLNIDYIIDDNWERISLEIGEQFSKTIIKQMLNGAIIETKKRIKRNMRLVVPQFYRDKIMFLVPIDFKLNENKIVTMAIAVERMNDNQYRANTIFTLEMAYAKARVLMRPEANWLLN